MAITTKAGHLVDDISKVSEEQASGIEPVNHAVSDMGGITRRSAASAEESASSAAGMTESSVSGSARHERA